jgi:hypothetical protein
MGAGFHGMTTTARDITTADGETFTDSEHVELARLIFKRWGCDMAAAAVAWRRLMQNNCTDTQFASVVQAPTDSELAARLCAKEAPKEPELVVAALAGAELPKVGDGATAYSWSDRHAYTIVEVVSPRCLKVQRDNVKCTSYEQQKYEYTPNPSAAVEVIVFKVTKRHPEGVWVRMSDGVKGQKFAIGHRDEYRDPSF